MRVWGGSKAGEDRPMKYIVGLAVSHLHVVGPVSTTPVGNQELTKCRLDDAPAVVDACSAPPVVLMSQLCDITPNAATFVTLRLVASLGTRLLVWRLSLSFVCGCGVCGEFCS